MSTGKIIPLAALGFATWAVYLGGLASLQSQCVSEDVNQPEGAGHLAGVYGFSAGLSNCMRLYGYYWFIMVVEFVLITAIGLVAVKGSVSQLQNAFLGLFAVATLLYINACNAFISAQSVDWYTWGAQADRIRAVTAGAIMTAVVNGFMVFALGVKPEDAAEPAAAETPKTPADVKQPAAEAKAESKDVESA
mmetsp:Transcript_36545/g.81344  ORF Transcript_36545/g.81344 Transcript_36545/m.81344 type:complete len:192 (+) Transcript_36545:86-661(+)|eukprot:CAMPEP_0202890282 /NCGR_PEP_ID=MMETSP1392-20130828/741_1 /ASSEMBLY_ACC=CAM_ASM_000868 /TAXON_ID=225041 /ORGANISM="Chlamydomonas chlamydogama, Strain SAG 11-48b" /LENGTH=191 /DNA_ID=CAMNT_0049573823 /DNA_START=73 /DNA_END=648 /DNA_ORIENTATION=+